MCLTETILTHEIGRNLHKIGICIVSSIVSQTWMILCGLQIRYPVCKGIIYRALLGMLADSTSVLHRATRERKVQFEQYAAAEGFLLARLGSASAYSVESGEGEV